MNLNLKQKKPSKIRRDRSTIHQSFLPRTDPVPPTNENETNENESKLSQNSKESAIDAETKAAKQRELIPYDTRIQQFREMLAEKQVRSIECLSFLEYAIHFRSVHLPLGNKN